MSKIEATLRDFAQDPTEQISLGEVPNVFEDFSEKAALAANLGGHDHVEALRRETAGIHAAHAATYQKIEADKSASAPSGSLAKRFGGTDPKRLFRRYFAEQTQLGKSVSEIVSTYTDQARSEFKTILAELCHEFGSVQ